VPSGDVANLRLWLAKQTNLAHPYLSPLSGDFSRGFPPTLLAGGTRDLLLSNAVRMHRSLRDADVPAELHVLEAAQHGLTPRTPEGESLARDVRKFISAHCPPRAP
jgi:monoterpene epsilon-lactone hydrolase